MSMRAPERILYTTNPGQYSKSGPQTANYIRADLYDQAIRERDYARAALTELVELKALKEQIEARRLSLWGEGFEDPDAAEEELESWRADYNRRKPIAWEAARAAIAKSEQS